MSGEPAYSLGSGDGYPQLGNAVTEPISWVETVATHDELQRALVIARGLIEFSYGPSTWRQVLAQARKPTDLPYSTDDTPRRRVRDWRGPPIQPSLRIQVSDIAISPERYEAIRAGLVELIADVRGRATPADPRTALAARPRPASASEA